MNKRQYQNKLIQIVHVAKRDLHLDDDAYRAMLLEMTGKDSTKGLGITELQTVVEHLKTRGFALRARSTAGKLEPIDDVEEEQIKKMRSLWLTLRDWGVLRDSSEQALRKFCKRQTGVERMEWLSVAQAQRLIEQLKSWVDRIDLQHDHDMIISTWDGLAARGKVTPGTAALDSFIREMFAEVMAGNYHKVTPPTDLRSLMRIRAHGFLLERLREMRDVD